MNFFSQTEKQKHTKLWCLRALNVHLPVSESRNLKGPVATVIERELKTLLENKDVRQVNADFLQRNSHSLLHRLSGKLHLSNRYLSSVTLSVVSTVINGASASRLKRNLEVSVFEEGGKPEKKTLEAGREPTTYSTHMRRPVRESNPGHRGGTGASAYPLRQPYFSILNCVVQQEKKKLCAVSVGK